MYKKTKKNWKSSKKKTKRKKIFKKIDKRKNLKKKKIKVRTGNIQQQEEVKPTHYKIEKKRQMTKQEICNNKRRSSMHSLPMLDFDIYL